MNKAEGKQVRKTAAKMQKNAPQSKKDAIAGQKNVRIMVDKFKGGRKK